MSFFDALHISSSGLSAQRLRMNLISDNLANVNTTRTKEGGAYRRKDVVFAAAAGGASFDRTLRSQMGAGKDPAGVEVSEIIEDPRPLQKKFEPGHPDADEDGYVTLPNVDIMEEMVNMISATRSYEANVSAVRASRTMALKALDIGT